MTVSQDTFHLGNWNALSSVGSTKVERNDRVNIVESDGNSEEYILQGRRVEGNNEREDGIKWTRTVTVVASDQKGRDGGSRE
jgi:hypothetical protein